MAEDEDPLVLVFIPSLVSVLLRKERAKGAPLTEAEVLAIRDDATCMAVPFSIAMEAERYPDIEAEDVWAEWRRVRGELGQADDGETPAAARRGRLPWRRRSSAD